MTKLGRGMHWSSYRFMAVVLSTLAAIAAFPARAVGDNAPAGRPTAGACVHTPLCPDDAIDGKGCCLKPPPDAQLTLTRRSPATPGGCPADMIAIPAGAFVMGNSPAEGQTDERKRVELPAYCIDRTEVTVAAYAACVASGACKAALEPADRGMAIWCNGTRADRQTHPINCVDWSQASDYCTSLNKRLPSEAEWEYAARGPRGQVYPWGNEPPSAQRLNACGGECGPLMDRMGFGAATMYKASDPWPTTAPVGSFPHGASPAGVLDLAGNVAEWTSGEPLGAGGRASHFNDGMHRVVRGGSWAQAAAASVSGATRDSYGPARRLPDVGFRCACGQ